MKLQGILILGMGHEGTFARCYKDLYSLQVWKQVRRYFITSKGVIAEEDKFLGQVF